MLLQGRNRERISMCVRVSEIERESERARSAAVEHHLQKCNGQQTGPGAGQTDREQTASYQCTRTNEKSCKF